MRKEVWVYAVEARGTWMRNEGLRMKDRQEVESFLRIIPNYVWKIIADGCSGHFVQHKTLRDSRRTCCNSEILCRKRFT